MKKIHPVPEALIQRWEEYSFYLLYEYFQKEIQYNLREDYKKRYPEGNCSTALAPSLGTIYALHSRMTGEVQAIVKACRELLSQSPDLVRIFHAGKLLTLDLYYLIWADSDQLFRTHIVLDLFWDTILGCIYSLRPLITKKYVFYTLFLFLPAICQELDHLYPVAVISRELACGFLQLMQQIGRRERPRTLW
jgi:hypothetical protein